MKERLIQLLNTMSLIETKGESTLIMTDCVRYVNDLIQECEEKEATPTKTDNA